MAQDQYDELHPDPDDGEPVDYDPFPEDRPAEVVQALEKLVRLEAETARASRSNTDKIVAAINRFTKSVDANTAAIEARREVVRDENGKIKATRVVH
jgi:hypothetical protein